MSSLQERKFYLQLWSFTTGPAIDVMKHYFEVKVLNTSSFESFLNDINNMHKLFHQCFPTTPCCYCTTASMAAPKKKGCLNLGQFDKLYDNSGSPIPSHEIMKGCKIDQICLCKYSAKSSVTVNDLDITLFNDIVQHCCSSKINFAWRKSIKDVRNFLAHAGAGYVNKQDFDDNWKILNTATLGFAGEIGKVCEKMFQTEIVRIQSCSTDELKGMLENSTENQAKMLNLLNGFKPIVDECKKTAELVHMKQESQDKQFENLQSVIGQSTREIGEIKHKMNKFDSFMKLMVEEKGKCTCDGSKRIKVETHVDNPGWNDENTAKCLRERLNADVDEQITDKEEFYIKNVENKCIQMELVAFPDVFKSPHSLRKAIKILINQLIDAGEVDTSMPGRMDIEFTIKTPLTKEEMAVAFLVFGGQDNLDESTENGLDLKLKLEDHMPVFKSITLGTKLSDNPDSEMDFSPIDERFVTVKPESISARYDEFFITVENVKCLLKITGIPENVEVLDGTEQELDNKGNTTCYVELILECPNTWNVEDIYANMNSNLSKLHGYFHIDFLEQTSDGQITIQTTVKENIFHSKTSLESAFLQLLSRVRTVCNLQSSKYEELSVTAAVLSVSHQRDLEDEKKTIKEEIKKSPITTEDNNVKCQFCKEEFECYKCTVKIQRMRILSRANRMKEQTISRLEKTSLQTEQEMTEEPLQKKRKTEITSPLEIPEEPEEGKSKTKDKEEIDISEDASKSLYTTDNIILVDVNQALQKLGEIQLVDYYIRIYNKYVMDLNRKWHGDSYQYYSCYQIRPRNAKAILDKLSKEQKKRTVLIAKLIDIIHTQGEFRTTDKAYGTDIGFLNVEIPATKCDYCEIEEASQISCYCKKCKIFICDNCVTVYRINHKEHAHIYLSNILREYEETNSWRSTLFKIYDVEYMYPDMLAILGKTKLFVNNLKGTLIKTCTLTSSSCFKSRIAWINDCKIAVSVPNDNLLHIVTIQPPFPTIVLRSPVEAMMTGGITCIMNSLYVAFSDAIRLMDLSGQIQRVFEIPNVNILHSVNNQKMLCVYSKDVLDKTMSYLDFDTGKVCDFELFPFHPEDITTDEVGNILFIVGGIIWQADSEGNNFKIIISRDRDEFCKKISYGKDSKTLVTTNEKINKEIVQLFRKPQ